MINWDELPLSKDDRYFLEIIVIASYEFSQFGKSRMSVIKVAFPFAQTRGKEIYITTGASDKVTLKYDWFTGSIKAMLTDTMIYFKVYGLKISS